jgi:hypothetical protein
MSFKNKSLYVKIIIFVGFIIFVYSVKIFLDHSSNISKIEDKKDSRVEAKLKALGINVINSTNPDSILFYKNKFELKSKLKLRYLVDSISKYGDVWDKFFIQDSVAIDFLNNWLSNDSSSLISWVNNSNKVKFKLPNFIFPLSTKNLIWKKFNLEQSNDLIVLTYLENNFKDAPIYFNQKVKDKSLDFDYLTSIFLQLSKSLDVEVIKNFPVEKINQEISDKAFKNLALAMINYSKSKNYNENQKAISLKLIQSYPKAKFLNSKNKNNYDFVTSDILSSLTLLQDPISVQNELYYFSANGIYLPATLSLLGDIEPLYVQNQLEKWSKGIGLHYYLPKTLLQLNYKSIDTNLISNYLNFLTTFNYNDIEFLVDDIAILCNHYFLSPKEILKHSKVPDTLELFSDVVNLCNLYNKNTEYYLFEMLKYGLIDFKKCYAEIKKIKQDLYSTIGNSLNDALELSGFYADFYSFSNNPIADFYNLIPFLIQHSTIQPSDISYDINLVEEDGKFKFYFTIIYNDVLYKYKYLSSTLKFKPSIVVKLLNYILIDNKLNKEFNEIKNNSGEMALFYGNTKDVTAFFSKHFIN